jgi:hypothetical protein
MINRAIQSGLALCWALALTPVLAAAQDAAKDQRLRARRGAGAEAHRRGAEQLATDAAARASQQRIDAIDDETIAAHQYRRALADAGSFTTYAKQLESQVQAQDEEMASISSSSARWRRPRGKCCL